MGRRYSVKVAYGSGVVVRTGTNFRTIEMLIVATIWYLLVITVLSVGQFFVERRVAER